MRMTEDGKIQSGIQNTWLQLSEKQETALKEEAQMRFKHIKVFQFSHLASLVLLL